MNCSSTRNIPTWAIWATLSLRRYLTTDVNQWIASNKWCLYLSPHSPHLSVMWLYLQYPAQLVVYGRPDNSAQLWPADDCLHTTIDRGNGEIIDNIIQQPTTPTYQFIKYCSDVLLWPARAHLNICYDQKKARQTSFWGMSTNQNYRHQILSLYTTSFHCYQYQKWEFIKCNWKNVEFYTFYTRSILHIHIHYISLLHFYGHLLERFHNWNLVVDGDQICIIQGSPVCSFMPGHPLRIPDLIWVVCWKWKNGLYYDV